MQTSILVSLPRIFVCTRWPDVALTVQSVLVTRQVRFFGWSGFWFGYNQFLLVCSWCSRCSCRGELGNFFCGQRRSFPFTSTHSVDPKFPIVKHNVQNQWKPRGWNFRSMRWLRLITVNTVIDAHWNAWIKYNGEDQSKHRFYVVVVGMSYTGSAPA